MHIIILRIFVPEDANGKKKEPELKTEDLCNDLS